MANPWAGEVAVVIDGKSHACKLTLGALAELEGSLGEGSLIDLIRRFENGGFSGRDVMSIIVAGLRGGGWTCLLYTSPSPRDKRQSRMPSSA